MQSFQAAERKPRRSRTLMVGAAIGSGLAARSGVRAGCDLLLALNAGRMRSMGAPSIVSLLPLADSNAMMLDVGGREILPFRGETPVYFGASCFDPRIDLSALIRQVAEVGFDGVANFPTSIFLQGAHRERIEQAGVGFSREVMLLVQAKAAGLKTLAYVATRDEARAMAMAGVDIINLNLGWNHGGDQGVTASLAIPDAGELARRVFREVRAINPDALCMIEGGPIVSPDDMYTVCDAARADGYIGGSTIDRLPMEVAVEESVMAFKTVGALRDRVRELETQRLRRARDYGILGGSEAISAVRDTIAAMPQDQEALLITGPAGSGKELVARAYAERMRCEEFICVPCDEFAEASLFGAAPGALRPGSGARLGLLESGDRTALFLDNAAALDPQVQRRLLTAIENRQFLRLGDSVSRPVSVRVALAAETTDGILPQLLTALSANAIAMPSLVGRIEDLPVLVAHFMASIGEPRPRIDGGSYRALMAHDWPGNVRELRIVLDRAAARAEGGVVRMEDIAAVLHGGRRIAPENEREWLLDALRRHRFRRTETAAYLGIARKTLYNKMQRLGLCDTDIR